MTSTADIGTVGRTITFNCFSDLDPVRIEWYRDDRLLSQTNSISGTVVLGLISTDDEGAVYTCRAIDGHHGSQEKNKILRVQGIIMKVCATPDGNNNNI